MIKAISAIGVVLACSSLLVSCTYLKYSSIQAEYARIQSTDPSQVNLKNMLDRDAFFVIGKTIDDSGKYSDVSMAVAAYSNKFKKNERVDTMFFKGAGRHYGLNLPDGVYTLLVYADKNNDQLFQQSEIVGERTLKLNIAGSADKTKTHVDIRLTGARLISWADTIAMPAKTEMKNSLFYPTGSIRSLNDSMFDERISLLGMYDPASFLEHAPTMFYALEEDVDNKIPVVFVHGIGGSSRAFEPIIKRMDRDRYKPWFFFYPSGGDLDNLADFFYSLFLSGDVIPLGKMPLIVVAHSMGGLVVREAINKYEGNASENHVELFVTIASPLGGHPSAASGEKHGLIVLPAWRDLNPDNRFIKELYRKPLPEFVNHQLFYAYKNPGSVKLGENSDGVVPLFSQLHPEAQKQSREQFGFNSGHADILENEAMISHLLNKMSGVDNVFPPAHMQILADGGFDVMLTDDYSAITRHVIGYAGKYLLLMVKGVIDPFYPTQEHFVQAVRGQVPATTDLEREFIRFMKEYPEIVNSTL